MLSLEEFKKAVENKKAKKKIDYCINNKDLKDSDVYEKMLAFKPPKMIINFLSELNGLTIILPRYIKILSPDSIKIIDDRYLMFALIQDKIQICFDMKVLNVANEWDVISYTDKYIITQTTSSFLTNKIWAWIDRGREIWKEENYPND